MSPEEKLYVDFHLKNGNKYYAMPLTQAEINQLITSVSADPNSSIIYVEVKQ